MDILNAADRIVYSGSVEAGVAWRAKNLASLGTHTVLLTADDARRLAAAKIDAVYPVYKQLNISRAGTDAEKAAMGTYIDAVRGWSNGADPTLSDLDAINPPA